MWPDYATFESSWLQTFLQKLPRTLKTRPIWSHWLTMVTEQWAYFLPKVAQLKSKNSRGMSYLANFEKKIGLLFITTSGHTAWLLPAVLAIVCDQVKHWTFLCVPVNDQSFVWTTLTFLSFFFITKMVPAGSVNDDPSLLLAEAKTSVLLYLTGKTLDSYFKAINPKK